MKLLSLFLGLLTWLGAFAQVEPNLPPMVDYNIHAVLDVEAKTITGKQTLRYTNHAPDIITELQFHMYFNGFKNNNSTYMREKGGPDYANSERWGYIHPSLIEVTQNQQTRPVEVRYVLAEDAAEGDQTVLSVPLTSPLLPGETLEVRFEFLGKIPQNQDRTGYAGDYYMLAQWFPKIGVWETAGVRGRVTPGWNCHSFHLETEFYADFGRYHVALDVPSNYQVASVGERDEAAETRLKQDWTEDQLEARELFVFRQDRIHDFAFAASPDFIFEERMYVASEWVSQDEIRRQAQRLGVAPEALVQRDVRVLLYIQPEHAGQIDRHFHIMMQSIKYHNLWYGDYPYPIITMVDPPLSAIETSGMEYPTLVVLRTHLTAPVNDLSLEDIIIHEFGHQYWYGMAASNEFEEAWLDEGIDTYTTNKIIDHLYPKTPVWRDIKEWRFHLPGMLGEPEGSAIEKYLTRGVDRSDLGAVVKPGWKFFRNHYGLNAYVKPGNNLVQLEHELGEDVMARVMYAYSMEWRFRHPNTRDFMDVVNRVSGRNMDWFFEALFFQPGKIDYAVDRVTNQSIPDRGYRDSPNGPERVVEPEETIIRAQVWIRNHGTTAYPIEIEVTFEGGETVRESWDGADVWTVFTYEGRGRVTQVEIDPEGRLVLDASPANNSWVRTANTTTSSRLSGKMLLKAQHLLQIFLGVL